MLLAEFKRVMELQCLAFFKSLLPSPQKAQQLYIKRIVKSINECNMERGSMNFQQQAAGSPKEDPFFANSSCTAFLSPVSSSGEQ